MARRRSFFLIGATALLAPPALAQSADPFADASLSSINSGAVSTSSSSGSARIDGGEFNSITVSAAGAQSSVKTTQIISITPDPSASANDQGDGGGTLNMAGGGNMIVGTTSTTTNYGSVRTKGSFSGAVIFGDRNSMSISSTGASTSYSISTSTPGSTPGSTPSN